MNTIITVGIDVGSSAVKTAVVRHGDGPPQMLAKQRERVLVGGQPQPQP